MKELKAKQLKEAISNSVLRVKAQRIPCIMYSCKDGSIAYLIGEGEGQFGLLDDDMGRAFNGGSQELAA